MDLSAGAQGGRSASIHSPRLVARSADLIPRRGFIHPHLVIRSFLTQMRILDPALLTHSRSVTYYDLVIAQALSLGPEEKKRLLYSSLLHDIGQMGIDRRIIEKREHLHPKEWDVIRAHPLNSERILSVFPCFSEIVPIIRHHHERYDGTGYPDGLVGKEIPFMSRLLAVADAFVAMTSIRPYRAALMISDALTIIEESKGKQFDPRLVDLFITVVVQNLKRRGTRGKRTASQDQR